MTMTQNAVQVVPIMRVEERVGRDAERRRPKVPGCWNGHDGKEVDHVRVAVLGVQVRGRDDENASSVADAHHARSCPRRE